ncbi:MAG: endonuclease MutS2 [Oscillospiraceae bacterium]|jgi:DNA mismatch repair protein MutS2|nr:endonuclease MutS2 [Oscillospiraceae bacterium]
MNVRTEHHLHALELDKILHLLAQQTASDAAAEMAEELRPANDLQDVQRLLTETWDAYRLMAKFGAPSFGDLHDISNPLRRAASGGTLNMGELLRIAVVLRCLRAVTDWRNKSAGIKTVLDDRFNCIVTNKYLEEKIFSCIDSEEEMNDNASPALANIRRKIRAASMRAKEKLDNMVHSPYYQKSLQEPIVTQRDGRYVVPVKSECRGEVPGLVHDSSGSGATVFIEPMAVVEANNEVRVLQNSEKDEIDRILQELSAEAGTFADSVIASCNMAAELDLIFAKASLGYQMKATLPQMNDRGEIDLKRARHPLIDKNKVVAIDVRLGTDFDTLVITGPNTGGKTVTLKTIGLLTLMAECGLLVPVSDNSSLSVFHHVLADIGDEQSIEQSLSTFSAHMTNIIRIMQEADEHSLVLLDELGAGTDPVEGAALATAILEQLRRQNARIAATTHYAELKAYALDTSGVENGSCEFDVATLQPTYRLLIGVPGRSNAFAISRRLGMDEAVVEYAKTLVSNENSRFENVVGQLEESRRALEDDRETTRREREEARLALEDARKKQEEIQRNAQKEMDKAREQASLLVSRTRGQADLLLNELEDLKKQKNKQLTAEQKAKLNAGLRQIEETADPVSKRRRNSGYHLPRALRVGDTVDIMDLDKQAVILELDADQKHALVQAGVIKTRTEISNLQLVTAAEKHKEERRRSRTVSKQFAASAPARAELDLRGQTASEAIANVDLFLDHAARSNLTQVTIIHGKGTGVLRKAVQDHLKHHANVKSYRLGTYGEGESGVTIAELK